VKLLCFAPVKDSRLLELVEFYREDIRILEGLGFEVVTETRTSAGARASADAVFAWWGGSSLPVVVASRARRRPCVVSGATGFRDRGDRTTRRVSRFALTVVASLFASRTLGVSELELRDLRRFGARRTMLSYHSVDVDYYRPGSRSETPSAATVAQMDAASISRKGIDLAIAATPLVRAQIPSFELDVIGPIAPDGAAWFDEARTRLDFTGVNLLGQLSREDKRVRLQNAWLYLQPSRYEAFGVSMVEAMACGAVPVHSACGALPEVVGGAGMQLAARTPEALAEAIVGLLADDARRRDLASRARARSLDFSREARAGKLAGVFAELGCLPVMT
jgi:glycosyltransferase involved in cell wall biosynthesis